MDEKKQIEEMARIANFTAFDYRQGAIQSKTIYTAIAEALFNQGYCKLPRGARIILDTTDQQIVVLTREEYKIIDHNIKHLERVCNDLEIRLEQNRKETAREIIVMLDDRNYITEQDLKNAIAKRYEVEVE